MGPCLQNKFNFHSYEKKGTGDSGESFCPSSTGDSEKNEFMIKIITLDNYSVSVLLTPDNRFIDILEIKNKKPNFSADPSGNISIDVNNEYPE